MDDNDNFQLKLSLTARLAFVDDLRTTQNIRDMRRHLDFAATATRKFEITLVPHASVHLLVFDRLTIQATQRMSDVDTHVLM